jgi:hypothetical protein
MSRQQRLVFAALAVVIAVVAVIVLAGGSDDEPETAATTSTPAATASATTDAEASPQETEEPTPEPTPEAVEIEVEGGKVQGGAVDIDVKQNENAVFTVKSDVADEVHVHGYDVMKDVEAGGSAEFDFKADIPGVFEIELEDAGIEIARLRVEP